MFLSGVIVPIITPFTPQQEINAFVLRQLIDRLVDAGVDGVMVGGTTGEAPLLSLEERMHLLEITLDQVRGRCAVVAQVGTLSTLDSMVLARHAVSCCVSAVSIIAPYFYRLSDDALVDHFCKILACIPADLPAYLYNIPQFTGNNIGKNVTLKVAQSYHNLAGEKESSGDLKLLIAKRSIRNETFDVLIGTDALILPALVLGACGMIAGNANLFPELFVQLFAAYRAKNLALAEETQRLIQVSTNACNADRSMFKAVLRYQGFAVGDVRPPQAQASQDTIQASIQKLCDSGLLTKVGM